MIMFVLRQLCKGTRRELLVNMSEIVRIRSTETNLEMREPQHKDFENRINHEENLLVQRRNQLFEWNKAKSMVLLPSKGNLMKYWLAEYESPEHRKVIARCVSGSLQYFYIFQQLIKESCFVILSSTSLTATFPDYG
ncbi:uncharacterized protein [Apostichopus japonicus]|uniref:uncharacterized protein isoform X1 n=1 Tax=Stichopus japonicus TaxID=307972 RepID=UPI003AB1FCC0